MPGRKGKPSLRTPANADTICELIADGWSLREVAVQLRCSNGSIHDWLEADPALAERYARARDRRAENMAFELQEIADEGRNDWMERNGGMVADHEHIQRSRLRVDTRKWLMSKMLPKKYGDSLSLTGAEGGPLVIRWEDGSKDG